MLVAIERQYWFLYRWAISSTKPSNYSNEIMMSQEEEQDEESLTMTKAGLLDSKGNDMPEIPLCGCLSVRFYQPYFDVDTADVTSRIAHALFYCKREENFLAFIRDKPDAYGPLWIATTLVFCVAVSSHISSWLSSWMLGKNWYVLVVLMYLLSFGREGLQFPNTSCVLHLLLTTPPLGNMTFSR